VNLRVMCYSHCLDSCCSALTVAGKQQAHLTKFAHKEKSKIYLFILIIDISLLQLIFHKIAYLIKPIINK